jgi:hypothetical protein
MASADVNPDPEVLAFGPRPIRRPSWRPVVLLVVAVLLVTTAGAVWSLRNRPTDELTFSDLQDVYAGMVRADGRNDSSVMSRDQPRPPPVAVSPLSCLPLVETTLADEFPHDALDGVSTYWLGEGASSAVSLFTLRYEDTAAAAGRYQVIADALTACDQGLVTVGDNTGRVTSTAVSYENGVPAQLGYLVTMTTGDRYAIAVLQYANTITWQFRLEVGNQAYEPYVAQRLMDSLVAQVRSIEELRRR